MAGFWKRVKKKREANQHSKLSAEKLADHYAAAMTDQGQLTEDQQQISRAVAEKASDIKRNHSLEAPDIQASTIAKIIKHLRPRCAPGADSITAEHLKHANSPRFCSALASLYTHCMSNSIVPSVFTVGVIVPIFKKPTLNPNEPKSYRPVTLSSVHSKVLELLMLPPDNISPSQYGFRQKRGTAFACSLFNDVQCYCRYKKSPLFTCSLDAEKCFDSLWHDALFYKLIDIIPNHHWATLHTWYTRLRAMVKWKGTFSNTFNVTRGTRQGSILSPCIFNYFLDGLLIKLNESNDCINIRDVHLNSFAYADDVTLLCSTVPGLQRLIDICSAYANEWRFTFGIAKTKCMISGKHGFSDDPKWHLNGLEIENVTEMDILGVTFCSNTSSSIHASKRVDKCKRSFYSLSDAGMSYPGCSSDAKAYMWNAICQPVLTYGMECLNLKKQDSDLINTTQSNCIKQSLGFSKRVKSSHLLEALNIVKTRYKINSLTCSLLYRIMHVDCPVQRLNALFLSMFICENVLIPGTLIERIVKLDLSPTRCAFVPPNVRRGGCRSNVANGITDSIRSMLLHSNFIKPYSDEHVLANLLIRAF